MKMPGPGAYIPPFKLALLQAQMTDKSSDEYQRVTWDALRKSLQGIVNKVNSANITLILPELFKENLLRGKGLFVRALMKAQVAFPNFSAIYAALVAVVNTKFPEIGELLLHRVTLQFRRAFQRGDKEVCTAGAQFIAHLANQGVVSEGLPLQVAILLLENPTDESVEICSAFVKQIGQYFVDEFRDGMMAIMDRLRVVLQEGDVSKKSQYIIESVMAIQASGFEKAGFPRVQEQLDLVEEED